MPLRRLFLSLFSIVSTLCAATVQERIDSLVNEYRVKEKECRSYNCRGELKTIEAKVKALRNLKLREERWERQANEETRHQINQAGLRLKASAGWMYAGVFFTLTGGVLAVTVDPAWVGIGASLVGALCALAAPYQIYKAGALLDNATGLGGGAIPDTKKPKAPAPKPPAPAPSPAPADTVNTWVTLPDSILTAPPAMADSLQREWEIAPADSVAPGVR